MENQEQAVGQEPESTEPETQEVEVPASEPIEPGEPVPETEHEPEQTPWPSDPVTDTPSPDPGLVDDLDAMAAVGSLQVRAEWIDPQGQHQGSAILQDRQDIAVLLDRLERPGAVRSCTLFVQGCTAPISIQDVAALRACLAG